MRSALVLSLIMVLAAGAILLAGCGGSESTPTTAYEGAKESAEVATCAANRRSISSVAQQYNAMEGKYPSSIQQLVPKYLQSVPTCPSGGKYTLQGSTVTCSVHGS